jgi:DNA-binding beta-propeller fold protein YncE
LTVFNDALDLDVRRETMKTFRFAPLLLGLAIGVLPMDGVSAQQSMAANSTASLVLVQRIPLPNVTGRMDHLSIDLEGNRLFAAALGDNQNTVEVIDLHAGKRVATIRGQSRPQGVFYSADFKKLFVANGGDGTYKVFRGDDLRLIDSVLLGTNPNHVGYDPAAKYLYVAFRDANAGHLAIVDTRTGNRVGDVRTDALPGEIKVESAGPRIFVTLQGLNELGVIDRNKREQIATWPLTQLVQSMALDEGDHRLFASGRVPAKVFVFDTESGKQIAELDCVSGIDDLWYDAARKRIYATGTDGIAVYDQKDADHYTMVRITNAPGAATSIWVPTLNRLFVSAPKVGDGEAAILVYEAPR